MAFSGWSIRFFVSLVSGGTGVNPKFFWASCAFLWLNCYGSSNFMLRLWRHQLESFKRAIYAFEILKWPDLLLNIATGGGKTVIIGGMIAYLKMVHSINQHLILVPNTTVRARLVDAFDIKSKDYIFKVFPYRLDGLHPDSEMIYVYDIRAAMREKVVKRVVVFRPDIERVKFTYYELETKKEITAEEMPWEDIERKKIPAVRYVTNPRPMAQQLGIALGCLKYQRKTVPEEPEGKDLYKPLLFVVALSIKDAETIKATLQSMELDGERLKWKYKLVTTGY